MDLTPYFNKEITRNKNYIEALEIVRSNIKSGNIWVIGGTVFRNIAKGLYHEIKDDKVYDFDFIIENPPKEDEVKVPLGWEYIRTGLGGIRLIKDARQIDIAPINDIVGITDKDHAQNMTSQEKIDSYLKRVMLTVQSIVHDVNNNKIIGDVGIKAIKNKIIEANNIDECISFCKRRRISIREFFRSKAESLSFTPHYLSFNHDPDKNLTIEFYDKYFKEFENRAIYDSFTFNYLRDELDLFIKKLPGKKILDLGSGPGRDSLYFKKLGLGPVCVDLSTSMVNQCREDGLEAIQMDIENLELENNTFDGVWAMASLLHVPKARIYNTLARIKEILKPEGVLFIEMIEGAGEIIHESRTTAPGQKRFFARYKEDEFKEILEQYFDVIKFKKFTTPLNHSFLNYICTPNSFVYKTGSLKR